MQEMTGMMTIENQSKITLSAIESVISLSDTQIVLSASGGRIQINGSSLKIIGFSSGNGSFSASGLIGAVKFIRKGEKIGRLFK